MYVATSAPSLSQLVIAAMLATALRTTTDVFVDVVLAARERIVYYHKTRSLRL